MTFSILGRCERTGRLGIAVTSSSPAVAARCASVRAGVGVAASQNVTDPRLGPALLDALAAGSPASAAIESVAAAAPYAWSGAQTLGIHGTRTGDGWACAGNLLASESVLDAVGAGFCASGDPELEGRLLHALAAGLQAGGEAGPLGSAGLLVAGAVAWPITDLRVDWADDDDDGAGPIERLTALWERWAPQRDDYVTRGLDPRAAPSYGVPGDSDPAQPKAPPADP
jgi:uncharacterized Ntn-hydrolase superfamily protein